jgi:glycosyltransferase involved in cell wall biosynthesis
MPAISTLMPCYNAERTLDEAVESIVRQTWADWELVVVDDGSSDSSSERLEAWTKRDPRVRLTRRERRGLVASLNDGLAACRGAWIARMDADDVSLPERFAEQAQVLESCPDVAAVGCQVEAFGEGPIGPGLRLYLEWINSLLTPEDIRREIFVESPLVHPSVLIRREWLVRVGGYQDRGWPEDYDLWLRMHLAGARFAKVPRILLRWREHAHRLTHLDPRYRIDAFLKAKAHYLIRGPLQGRESVLVWGAGLVGKRLARHLIQAGAPLKAFIDIDPAKIGRTRRGLPVLAPEGCLDAWREARRPVLLAAVGARGARAQVREQVNGFGLVEGRDWWAVA